MAEQDKKQMQVKVVGYDGPKKQKHDFSPINSHEESSNVSGR